MTLQLALGVTLLLGLPLLLLAIGVLAHVYLLFHPREGAMRDELVEAMVAESVEQLLTQLRGGAAFDGTPVPRTQTSMLQGTRAISTTAPLRAPAGVVRPFGQPATVAPSPSGANLVYAVSQLVAEGLSDRSIARRLSVGVDEVRVARAARGGSR